MPVITMVISMVFYRKAYSGARKWAVLPIVLGVALAFYGDMSYTAIGVFYTAACVVLAALKAVVGGELLTGDLKLHEMDLLSKMCPLALIWIGLAAICTGEVHYLVAYLCVACMFTYSCCACFYPHLTVLCGILSHNYYKVSAILGRWEELALSSAPQVVLLTGVLSFSLNVSSFVANKNTSPLTLCIAANLKQVNSSALSLHSHVEPCLSILIFVCNNVLHKWQVLVVACGSMFLGENIPLLNGIGILVVVFGSFRYGQISIEEKGGN